MIDWRGSSGKAAAEEVSTSVRDEYNGARRTEGFGLIYLDSGSNVYTSDPAEPDDPSQWWGSIACTGTSKILTCWPGRKGQRLVEGSTGL